MQLVRLTDGGETRAVTAEGVLLLSLMFAEGEGGPVSEVDRIRAKDGVRPGWHALVDRLYDVLGAENAARASRGEPPARVLWPSPATEMGQLRIYIDGKLSAETR
ncbi:MAG TPA: hypothetical protein VE261_08290, partial [Gaiellaceae bacterium]|nr:hypothetical protein [Gaiellaceae bacterium]